MREEEPYTPEAGPGCGLAVYALMILGLAVIAGSFVMGSTFFIVRASLQEEPRALRRGGEIQVRRLKPLRDVGILGPSEVPQAWYDESMLGDGSVACALVRDSLVRVEEGRATQLALAELTDVVTEGDEETGLVITAADSAGQTIRCTFGPNHGGIRLFRQLQAEQDQKP